MKRIFFLITGVFMAMLVWSENELPIDEISIYSSGVAYYEHSGEIDGSKNFDFLFSTAQISDVLKSISIQDGGATKIALKYSSSDTLKKTLESLSVNLSNGTQLKDILQGQIGSEIQVTAKDTVVGKIISVEKISNAEKSNTVLSLLTGTGIKLVNLEDVDGFKFMDAQKNTDLNKALNLILEQAGQQQRKLTIDITGKQKRPVKIAYVMEAPVWKPNYRLELGNKTAVFQAWAIVDNSTNFDWNNIKLNLITGKPVSFRQNLFEPFYVKREEIPVAVEGSADLQLYESDYDEMSAEMIGSTPRRNHSAKIAGADSALSDDVFSAKTNSVSSEKFIFTPAEPVTLERQKSMMIPLKVTTIPAEKISVFSNLPYRQAVNPKLCIELKNTSGINLPAGPITIYDRGYSGDSLIKFLPKDESRLIAYGDNLLMQGSTKENKTDYIEAVIVKDGNMKIKYSKIYKTVYKINNQDSKANSIIIEHQINDGELYETEKPYETTADLYRFKTEVPAKKSISYTVKERDTFDSVYSLANFNENQIIQYSTNGDMPQSVKKMFERLLTEYRKIKTAQQRLDNLVEQKKSLTNEQKRIRENFSVLKDSDHSDSFLNKLLKIETELESINKSIESAKKELNNAKTNYSLFIDDLKLEAM